jgi:hypothetical protein
LAHSPAVQSPSISGHVEPSAMHTDEPSFDTQHPALQAEPSLQHASPGPPQ